MLGFNRQPIIAVERGFSSQIRYHGMILLTAMQLLKLFQRAITYHQFDPLLLIAIHSDMRP